MNIIFCNIKELQKYKGVNSNNECKNHEEFIEGFDEEFEISNFDNYNEKYYGDVDI